MAIYLPSTAEEEQLALDELTPREIVAELDKHVIGQKDAKRAVAIALRNRTRRQKLPPDLAEEIVPKNIIMIGPTGVGKTEIARRLAKLAQAPFVKVEASKFTEVGYVGRDVDSIVRDLVEVAMQMVRTEQLEHVHARAAEHAEQRLVELLSAPLASSGQQPAPSQPGVTFGPFLVSSQGAVTPPKTAGAPRDMPEIRAKLRAGELEDEQIELDVHETQSPLVSVLGGQGLEDMEIRLKEMLGSIPGLGGKTQRRRMRVGDARRVLEDEEAQKLIDHDQVKREAVRRTEQAGIVFLDEIDKVAGERSHAG